MNVYFKRATVTKKASANMQIPELHKRREKNVSNNSWTRQKNINQKTALRFLWQLANMC